MKRFHLGALAAITTALVPLAALAEYPERDVRMIVPWGAGGGTDGIVRKVTTLAEDSLGGTIYVENIEGGISATGVGKVMSARPDGYTLGALTYDSVVTIPWQAMLPSYKMDKLDLIARITSEADAIIVDAESDYQSLDDLIAAAKADPGNVRIGVQNLGGRVHLTLLQLQKITGAEFKVVSYPGGAAPQKEALLSNEVDVVLTSLGDFANLIEDGTARGIVEFSDAKNPTYDVPTSLEAGVDLLNGSFIVIAAPAGTPEDVVAKIEAAYEAAYTSDEFQDWLATIGVTPNWLAGDALDEWAAKTSDDLFTEMNALVEAGVLSR